MIVDLSHVVALPEHRRHGGPLPRPVHTTPLSAGVPIMENLTALCGLPRDGFRVFAAPVAFRGAASLPVRVFALVDGDKTPVSRRRPQLLAPH